MVLIMKYKCIVSYDGYGFNGYQRQKHDKNTIQEVIENVLSTIFKEKIVIYGSGRTDKSVHAIGQVFHFESDKNVPVNNLKKAMNEINESTQNIIPRSPQSFSYQYNRNLDDPALSRGVAVHL